MNGLRTSLCPLAPPVPFLEILEAWQRAGFAPAACRSELERIIQENQIPRKFFDSSAIPRGGRPATDELLLGFYSQEREWIWRIDAPSGVRLFEVSPEVVPAIGALVRMACVAESIDDFFAEAGKLGHDEEFVRLVASCLTDEAPFGRWPAADLPGLYRREHASLLLRTPDAALVTDPQSLTSHWTTNFGRYPADLQPLPTARVLITHGHSDHWDLCSTLRWARKDEPVIIPRVPVPSLLSPDMRRELEMAGQSATAPEWYSTIRVGDVELDVLPFYGEQPTRELSLPSPLRNWGNCYRIHTAEWSAVVLVDGGADAQGTMVEAVARSVADRGPIDVVISCCDEFPEAVNPGLPHYVFTIPFAQLREIWPRRRSITAGPSGLAEICDAARARWFMAYADGFGGLGREPFGEGDATSEAEQAAAVARALAARSVETEVLRWNPGDCMAWSGGRPVIYAPGPDPR